MHTPQSIQASGLTFAFPSSIEIASLGHSSTQDSQPVHFSLSTCAGITQPFQKNDLNTTNETITTYSPRPKFQRIYPPSVRRPSLPRELWPGTTDEMLHNHNHNTKQIFLKFSRNFRRRQANQLLLPSQEGGKAVAVGVRVLL